MTRIAPQFSKKLREPGADKPARMVRRCSAEGCRNPATKQFGLFAACSIECGAIIAQKAAAKLRQQAEKVAKEERKRDRKRLMAMKPISYRLAKTQIACNAYIRLRDKEQNCISCDKKPDAERAWDAGHFRGRRAAPELRFDPDNIHKQCVHCNMFLGGNVIEYRKRLVERIGQERVERLEGPHPPVKWTREGLDELRRKFNAMARDLEKQWTES